MIEVERNNGGVHNVERILVQNSVNACVYVCVCKWEQHRSANVCIHKKCECMHMHMCVCSPPPLPLPLPLPAKSHSLSSSAFALSASFCVAFASAFASTFAPLRFATIARGVPCVLTINVRIGSQRYPSMAMSDHIRPAPVPPHHGNPSASNQYMRQGSRQKGIGYQGTPTGCQPQWWLNPCLDAKAEAN